MKRYPFQRFGLAATFAAVTALGAAGSLSAQTFDGELVIGDMQPLSGPSAAGGMTNHRGVELAIKQYNEGTHPLNPTPGLTVGGKTYKLKTVVYDHRYTSEGGVSAGNKLVFEDKTKFVVGTWGSAPSIAAAETVFEPNKVLFASTGWSRKVIGEDKPYTFRLTPVGTQYNEAFYVWAAENRPDIKTVVIVTRNDESGWGSVPEINAVIKKFGGKTLGVELWDPGTTDFYPFLTRAMAKEPDMIDVTSNPIEEGLMMKQLHELGYEGAVKGLCSLPDVTIETAGSKEASEGAYCVGGLNYDSGPPIISEGHRRFADAYLAEYKEDVPFQGMQVYDMTIGILEAIKKADSLDSTKVRDVLRTLSWELSSGDMASWGGKKLYGRDHQLISPTYVSIIKDGKMVTIGKAFVAVP